MSVGKSGDSTRAVQMVVRKTANVPQVIAWKELGHRDCVDICLYNSDRARLEIFALRGAKRFLGRTRASEFGRGRTAAKGDRRFRAWPANCRCACPTISFAHRRSGGVSRNDSNPD